MLTKKEKEVLILLGNGETYKTISKIMNVSLYKLRMIKNCFLKKLEARNDIQALYFAISKGILKITEFRN